MNRDDIIRMARESGMRFHKEAPTEIEYFYVYPDALEHFANLVANHVLVQPCCGNFEKCQRLCMPRAAAAERQKVALWMIQRSYATGHGDTTEDLLAELEWQIAENWNRAMINGVETEREACAKVCENYPDPIYVWTDVKAKFADAIRARREQ